MNRVPARLTAIVVFLAVVLIANVARGQESKEKTKPKAKPDGDQVRKLVEQLKSANFKTRDKAAQELSKLEDVPSALRDAAKSSDLETKRRAEAVVAVITARIEEKAFQAMVADLSKVEVDRLVRRMVSDKKAGADEKAWKIIEALVKAVTKQANKLGGTTYDVPDFDIKALAFADLTVERVAFNNKRILLKESDPRSTSIRGCVVLCAGNMPRTTSLSRSIAIVDGDFTGATGIHNSILIVRGNVGRVTVVSKSIVLATGNFEGATGCDHSFLQVNNERIRFTGSKESVLVKTAVRTTGPTDTRVLDTDKGPLQLLKFSERKSDAKLAWSKEVDGLAVAITPTDQKDKFLVRWKNVGKDAFSLPVVRRNMDMINQGADDLLGHVFLKGPDGKVAAVRKYPPGRIVGGLRFARGFVLGPGKVHEEIIDLWAYVERPADEGRYQLSIELDSPVGRRTLEFDVKTWSGKIQSNALDVNVAK